jgi:hypothetical protein
MKKIFTLAIGSLFALSVMAADHKPSVTVKSNSNCQLVIDGKSYRGDNFIDLSNLYPGYHSIKVYEVNKHLFFKKRAKLVSSSDFTVKGNDIVINIDRFGKIDIDESRFGYDRDHGKGWDKNSKDFGRSDHKDPHKKNF